MGKEKIKMWYWYFSRPNELMLDIDRPEFLNHARRRLQGAIDCGKLNVEHAWIFPSSRTGHAHMVVKLNHGLQPIERFVWEIILRGDLYRGCNNIMRSLRGIGAASGLLITRKAYLFRDHDAVCECEDKHSAEIMDRCPIAIQYRGELRNYGFFGKPSEKLFDNFTVCK